MTIASSAISASRPRLPPTRAAVNTPCLAGPFDGLHDVRRVAADAQHEHEVARPGIILELADEDVFVGVVVAQRGDPTDVVVERQHAEALADLVAGAFAEVGGEVRGVGGAAAVAEDEDLPVFVDARFGAGRSAGRRRRAGSNRGRPFAQRCSCSSNRRALLGRAGCFTCHVRIPCSRLRMRQMHRADGHGVFAQRRQPHRRPRRERLHHERPQRICDRRPQRLADERQPAAEDDDVRVGQMDDVRQGKADVAGTSSITRWANTSPADKAEDGFLI